MNSKRMHVNTWMNQKKIKTTELSRKGNVGMKEGFNRCRKFKNSKIEKFNKSNFKNSVESFANRLDQEKTEHQGLKAKAHELDIQTIIKKKNKKVQTEHARPLRHR
jgi:adenosylcobinamide amidohydrolase